MINLIGISGKTQSGKDTVGKIILKLDDISSPATSCVTKHNWQIKKFAGKLKDIACLLIGCTREQLEDEKFKEKELGEEWWYWEIPIKGTRSCFGGLYLTEEEAINSMRFASMSVENPILVKLTPRLLLQLLGTECGRQIIHPNIWVNALFTDYIPRHKILIRKQQRVGFGELKDLGIFEEERVSNWIITDVRFPNEADAIRERGGIIIRVNRKHGYNTPDGKWKEIPINYHESETALDNYDFDYVIENHKTIKELEEEVKEVYNKIKIL